MYKFKHFTTTEMDAICRGATLGLTDTQDGRFDGLSVTLSPKFYKETAANIINRALDAEIVQRVVDDKSQDENKTIRKDSMTGENEIFDLFAEIWDVLRKHPDYLNRKHHIDMDIDQEKKEQQYTNNFTLTIHTESDDQSQSLIGSNTLDKDFRKEI